jgi:CheY-like chemotaxis protein
MTTVGPILILTEQPVIAALVGMLVELAGCEAVFAGDDEQPADALTRLRPLAVILIDAEMNAARSDLLFALAARKQIGLVVFGAGGRAREVAEIAAQRQIPWVTLPPDLERLAAVIDLVCKKKPLGRQHDRREPAEAVVSADGTCILRDTAGRNWIVYDRRSASDRRVNEDGEVGDRVFVAEDGETRHCELPAVELSERAANVLEEQLSRALR